MQPFSNPEKFESFRPLTEDTHSDGTPKSTGNAFDVKAYIAKKKEEPKFSNHNVTKRSTGTVYTRKDDAKVAEEPVVKKEPEKNADGSIKRGRGRPPGKYGSYKKKISEALANHSMEFGQEINELSSLTLKNYIGGAAMKSATANTHQDKMKAIRRVGKIENAARKIAKKAQWAEETEVKEQVQYDLDNLSFSSIVNSAVDTTKGI